MFLLLDISHNEDGEKLRPLIPESELGMLMQAPQK